MELHFHSHEAASLAVARFRGDGHLACVVDEHTPFLWGSAAVSGVRIWVMDEAKAEGAGAAEEEHSLFAEVHEVCIQNCLRFLLGCCCVLFMATLVLALSAGIASSPSFYLWLVLSAAFFVPASGKILTNWTRRGVHVLLCVFCLILGPIFIIDLLLLAWHFPVSFAILFFAVVLGLVALVELGRRFETGIHSSVLRTGEYLGFRDRLVAGVCVLVICIRCIMA